MKYTYNNQYKY